MGALNFIYSHDDIFRGVKQESSHLAERRFDRESNSLFEQVVFDEEYLIKFRELFFDAQAEVVPALSAYMKEVPAGGGYFETQDFSKDRDFCFVLLMPDDWNFHLVKPVDIKIKQFLIAYVMYRWLETKLPEEAAVYQQRASSVLSEAKALLEKRTRPIRRAHGYFEN